VAEFGSIVPFPIERVYWIYQTPADIVRGQHAHIELRQILVAISGTINIKCEYLDGSIEEFLLDHPSKGLYVPQMVWRFINFSYQAVMICIASEKYSEMDYIRDYSKFEKLRATFMMTAH